MGDTITRMVAAAALVVATTTTTACTQRPGTSYQLVIEKGFAPNQEQAIVAAASDWTDKVADLRLDVVVGQCADVENGVICVRPTDHAGVVREGRGDQGLIDITDCVHGVFSSSPTTGGVGGKDGGEVWMDAAYGQEDGDTSGLAIFQTGAGHEMGHAMGLAHDPLRGTLMYATEGGASRSGVTASDIEQWYAIRR
jgi:hypothetical protein